METALENQLSDYLRRLAEEERSLTERSASISHAKRELDWRMEVADRLRAAIRDLAAYDEAKAKGVLGQEE